jgi:peptide/nickel transport system substrate-binding protein
MSPRLLALIAACAVSFLMCGRSSTERDTTAYVALTADVENFNPIITGAATSTDVESAIYPEMFNVVFNPTQGKLDFRPALVKDWEFLNDGKDLRLVLRTDIKWSDGVTVSPADVKFSFELYGDPQVASPRRNQVDRMIFTNGAFDVNKSIEIVDDSTMLFHFASAYSESKQLFHLNLPPVPKHVYEKVDRRSIRNSDHNNNPRSAGPFIVEKWERQQQIVLASNPRCTYPGPAALGRVIFRIIKEPAARLTELKKGTVDVMWPVDPKDAKDIQENNPDVRLVTTPPRSHDYVGWANIDFEEYNRSGGKVIRPHRLFGDRRVRQAMTYAINRRAIIDKKLPAYGELAVTDFSPIFRWAINNELVPYPYDPNTARQLLREAGWTDTDGDGILDKDGMRFEFDLAYISSNERRKYAAEIIQSNLKLVGIKVGIVPVEAVVFISNLQQKKYDAFISGWRVSLEIDPSDRWGDIASEFNTVGYANPTVVALTNRGLQARSDRDAVYYWKDLQAILHQDQPCTFLYWIKDIVGVNRRLKNTDISFIGVLDNMGRWTIGDPKGYEN